MSSEYNEIKLKIGNFNVMLEIWKDPPLIWIAKMTACPRWFGTPNQEWFGKGHSENFILL